MAMDGGKLTLLALILLIADVQCLMFNLEPNGNKCLKEEVQANVIVTGEYEVSDAPGQHVDYIVRNKVLLNSRVAWYS